MTWAEIVKAVKSEGGFDATDAQVQAWLLDRAQYLNAEAKFFKATIDFNGLVPGQGTYIVDPEVVDLEVVLGNGRPYEQVTAGQMDNIRAGIVRADGPVCTLSYSDRGVPLLDILPVPTEEGTLTARAILPYPEPDWATDSPGFPVDFHKGLIDGAIAIGLSRIDERIADAQFFEAAFLSQVDRLRRRLNGRAGKGPVQIQVRGYHF
jgi:hypothetical protein